MEKIATLEIENSSFRVTVGYLLDNKVDIIYRKVFPLTIPLNDFDIYDFESLANDLSVLKHLEDKKLTIPVNEVVLIYPPYGLDVYTSTKETNTISDDSKITALDISNCLSIIKKERIPNPNNIMVDVIPNLFYLDNNVEIFQPPLDRFSSILRIKANIYTLPKKMIDDIKKVLSMIKIKVKKEVIAPVGTTYLLTSLHYNPIHYFLINFGERTTTVSLVSGRSVVSSTYFPTGIEHLVDRISLNFNIDKDVANKFKNILGLDERKSTFNPSIFQDNDGEFSKRINNEDLVNIVSSFLKEWVVSIKNAFSTLFIDGANKLNLPIVLTGEGSELNGLLGYLKRFFVDTSITIFKTNTVGAIEPSWVNSIAAIYFTSVYKGSLADNEKNKVNEVSRIESKNEDYSELKDTL